MEKIKIKHMGLLSLIAIGIIAMSFSNQISDFFNELKRQRIERDIESYRPTFELYNKKIEDETLYDIFYCIDFFNIDSIEGHKDICLGQILKESGGKHSIRGKITTSSAGALGLCQIKPSTAFQYLRYEIPECDKELLLQLGVDDFEWANNYEVKKSEGGNYYVPQKAFNKSKKWISDEKNNIIMWAYIMKKNIQKHGIDEALIIYNMGYGGFKKYIKSGKKIENHPYIVGINKIKRAFLSEGSETANQ